MIDFVRNFEAMRNLTFKSPTLSAVRLIAIAGGWHQRSKDQEDLIRFSDPFFVQARDSKTKTKNPAESSSSTAGA